MQLNWLDRTIAYFSPTRGEARARSRAVMAALLAYEGTSRGRRTAGWVTPQPTSGDAEVGAAHRFMRDRARDLVRNNPHAAKGLRVLVSNRIGTGIMCQPAGAGPSEREAEAMMRQALAAHPWQAVRLQGTRRPNRRKANRLYERWKRWVDRCDLLGQTDFYGLMSLAERTRIEAGEALIRLHSMPNITDMNDVPLRLQVLEPDLIDSDKNEKVSATTEIRYGVEFQNFAPAAYWLFDEHPGDGTTMYTKSSRIPARDVIHYYKPLRPGQSRGITEFASVMLRLRALDDYDDAEVMRKKVAACLTAFVTTPSGLPGASLGPTDFDEGLGRRQEQFSPGGIAYLKPGESVAVADPRPSSDYESFNKVQIRAIAAGLDMPYELLSGDLSEVNYTSHRGGLVQFRGSIEADQWQLTVPQVCARVTARFAQEALAVDGMIDPDSTWIYTPPRFGLLDPSKEIPAIIEAVKGGIDSYPNALRREGYDWREKLDEIDEFQKEVEARGIALTSVPPPSAPALTASAPSTPSRPAARPSSGNGAAP